MKSIVAKKIQELMTNSGYFYFIDILYYRTQINIMGKSLTEVKSISPENTFVELEIVGDVGSVETCRLQCLALIDELVH